MPAHTAGAADPPRGNKALSICVDLAALGPQPSVEEFVAAAHERLARAFGCSSGHVAVAVRENRAPDDPLEGWRLPVFYAIGAGSSDEALAVETEICQETYLRDPIVKNVIRDAGRHRVYHDPDPATAPNRQGTLDAKYWSLLGLVDRLKLVHALEADVEVHVSIDRRTGAALFERDDAIVLEDVVPALGPWARRLALLHGYAPACAPLTVRERQVASRLLGHAPLKLLADQLGLSEARAREIVRAVYRKLGVGGRLELQSRWAGTRLAPAAQPIATTRPHRRRRR